MNDPILRLAVPGKPRALARHRHFKGGTFDSQAFEKKRYAAHVVSLLDGLYEPPEAIELEIEYLFRPPSSWSKKRREQAIGSPKLTIPDLSNLIKFTEDALNGILWTDDRLINKITASKAYSSWEGTIIQVFATE